MNRNFRVFAGALGLGMIATLAVFGAGFGWLHLYAPAAIPDASVVNIRATVPEVVQAVPAAVLATQTTAKGDDFRPEISGTAGSQDPSRVLVAAIQQQLRRHGCYADSVDGTWSASTKAAVGRFTGRLDLRRGSDVPDDLLLRALESEKQAVCSTDDKHASGVPPSTDAVSAGSAGRNEPRTGTPSGGQSVFAPQPLQSAARSPNDGTSTHDAASNSVLVKPPGVGAGGAELRSDEGRSDPAAAAATLSAADTPVEAIVPDRKAGPARDARKSARSQRPAQRQGETFRRLERDAP